MVFSGEGKAFTHYFPLITYFLNVVELILLWWLLFILDEGGRAGFLFFFYLSLKCILQLLLYIVKGV